MHTSTAIAALSLASIAGLEILLGYPTVALAIVTVAVCMVAWDFGHFLGRMLCKHAEAMYRE